MSSASARSPSTTSDSSTHQGSKRKGLFGGFKKNKASASQTEYSSGPSAFAQISQQRQSLPAGLSAVHEPHHHHHAGDPSDVFEDASTASASAASPPPTASSSTATTPVASAAVPLKSTRGERNSVSSVISVVDKGERCRHGYLPPAMTLGGKVITQTHSKTPDATAITKGDLEITLHEGRELIACDRSGTSDPYVRFTLGKESYRSRVEKRTLQPVWDENFFVNVPTLSVPLEIEVWDWDKVGKGTAMGTASVSLSALSDGNVHEMWVKLRGVAHGEIRLTLQVVDTAGDDFAVPKRKKGGNLAALKRREKREVKKTKNRVGTLTVVLLEGIDLAIRDPDVGSSDPYVRLQMGKQKVKSSVVHKSLNPTWEQMFEFQVRSRDTPLELRVFDQDAVGHDDPMGRAQIDLHDLSDNITKELEVSLVEVESGSLKLLVSLTWHAEMDEEENLRLREAMAENYLKPGKVKAVGIAEVQIIDASNLRAADANGTSDPYVVVELGNTRLRTPTIFKTLNPSWNKVYHVPIKDITQSLEFTVFDEDRNGPGDFLGKAIVPLLNCRSTTQTLHLKKKNLMDACKGGKGSIRVKIAVEFWAHKAFINTFQARETKYMDPDPKFKGAILKTNVNRVKKVVMSFINGFRSLNGVFMWSGNKMTSSITWVLWTLYCLKFQWYFIPLALIALMMYRLAVKTMQAKVIDGVDMTEDLYEEDEEDDDEEEEDDEPRRGLLEKIRAIEKILTVVQGALGGLAGFFEKWKNLFNWSVPFMSKSWIVLLAIVTFLLYLVPMKYVFVFAGIMKFSKVLRKPAGYVGNDEILDFVGRVPCDMIKQQRRPLPPPDVRRARKAAKTRKNK